MKDKTPAAPVELPEDKAGLVPATDCENTEKETPAPPKIKSFNATKCGFC